MKNNLLKLLQKTGWKKGDSLSIQKTDYSGLQTKSFFEGEFIGWSGHSNKSLGTGIEKKSKGDRT